MTEDEQASGWLDRVAFPCMTLNEQAAARRDALWGTRVTFSPRVFISLTRRRRDGIWLPDPEQVLEIAGADARAGCHEALFTLGEAPEQRHAVARAWLAERGYGSTVDYLVAMCALVLEETGLLPQSNAGALQRGELARLREVTVSQGMMLESLRADLPCHHSAPEKHPDRRLATLEAAGELAIPFTTGILVGIGEGRSDRVEALEAIAATHRRHGHVQEAIVQTFLPNPGSGMRDHPRAPVINDVHVTTPPLDMTRAAIGPARDDRAASARARPSGRRPRAPGASVDRAAAGA